MSILENNREFSTEMEKLEPTTGAHADVFNERFSQLLSNDESLNSDKKSLENEIKKKISDMSNKVDTAQQTADIATNIANGRNQSVSYTSYEEMITALNAMSGDNFRSGQNIYIGTVGVPDLWIYSIEETPVEYTYVDDDTFVSKLDENVAVQIGYYKVAQLEGQKVDLTTINESLAAQEEQISGLNSSLSGKAPSSHTHDERYYTETEIDDKMLSIDTKVKDIDSILSHQANHYVVTANGYADIRSNVGVLSTNEDGTQFNTFCGSDFITNDGISLRNLKNGLSNVILNQSLPKGANIDDIVYPTTPFSCWVCFNKADHPFYVITGYNISTNIIYGTIFFGRNFQIFCELVDMHMFLRINSNNEWTDWKAMPNYSDLGTQCTYSLSGTTLTITTK